MARDRQRAKQRRARREKSGGLPAPNPIERENVPEGFDHGSADIDIVEASIVAGAEGEIAPDGSITVDGEADPEGLTDAEFAELEDEVEEVEEAIESGDQDEIERAEAEAEGSAVTRRDKRAKSSDGTPAPTKKGGFRFVAFLRASWSELQRVQWPDRRQVGQATAVVLGFVVVAGLYLGVADAFAKWLVDRIV